MSILIGLSLICGANAVFLIGVIVYALNKSLFIPPPSGLVNPAAAVSLPPSIMLRFVESVPIGEADAMLIGAAIL